MGVCGIIRRVGGGVDATYTFLVGCGGLASDLTGAATIRESADDNEGSSLLERSIGAARGDCDDNGGVVWVCCARSLHESILCTMRCGSILATRLYSKISSCCALGGRDGLQSIQRRSARGCGITSRQQQAG